MKVCSSKKVATALLGPGLPSYLNQNSLRPKEDTNLSWGPQLLLGQRVIQCGMLSGSSVGPWEKSPFWMSEEHAVAVGVGMQEQAELILATLVEQAVAANAGMFVVAVVVYWVNALQKEVAAASLEVGEVARRARRQLCFRQSTHFSRWRTHNLLISFANTLSVNNGQYTEETKQVSRQFMMEMHCNVRYFP